MMIDKGKEDGIIFRANSASNTFYMFRINTSGSYALDLYQNSKLTSTLTNGYSTAISTALKASNILAVVAYKGTFYLFDNQQLLTNVTDNTLSSGKIGVAAIDYTAPTEAEFSNNFYEYIDGDNEPNSYRDDNTNSWYNGKFNTLGITVYKSYQNTIGSC
jgi:hypothetical protein